MSSAASTDPSASLGTKVSSAPGGSSAGRDSLQPWQLFTLAGLIGATIVVFLSRGQSAPSIILLSCSIFAAAYIATAALRTVLPLTGNIPDDDPEMLGQRTRAALEREKTLVLRSLKELEFDRGMKKLSEKDYAEMSARLRARATRLMRQLDAGSIYREEIEREVAKRLPKSSVAQPSVTMCASCNTKNERDAKFCKNCGARLGAAS
jgi:hypothetical protein